jgi:hypothetical protein
MHKPGTRVGAILKADATTVHLIGYGTLIEEEVPGPEAQGWMAEGLREHKRTNPTILFDDEAKVWGCECWWATEERVKEVIGSRKVVAAPRSTWASE